MSEREQIWQAASGQWRHKGALTVLWGAIGSHLETAPPKQGLKRQMSQSRRSRTKRGVRRGQRLPPFSPRTRVTVGGVKRGKIGHQPSAGEGRAAERREWAPVAGRPPECPAAGDGDLNALTHPQSFPAVPSRFSPTNPPTQSSHPICFVAIL